MTILEPTPGATAPGQTIAPRPRFVVQGFLGGTIAIALLGLAGQDLHQTLLIAPFGASCVLLFAAPASPFAQPRNLIGGHLLTAAIGLAMLWIFGNSALSMGVAVGLVIALMELTGTVHPPAGANPIVIMLAGKASLWFLLTPILAGVLFLLLVALVVNNLGGRRWPTRWR
jgi:CBS-domain-containing membrane protein